MEEATKLLEEYQDRLDRALLEGTKKYETVFAEPPAGVGVHEIDSTRTITRVNRVEPGLLGYRPEEMVGKAVLDFIVMSEASRRAIERKLAGDVTLKPFVRTFRRADGGAVLMALVDRHLKDAQGRIVGIRTALRQISN
jgi:PAS domain S-box-containing protein